MTLDPAPSFIVQFPVPKAVSISVSMHSLVSGPLHQIAQKLKIGFCLKRLMQVNQLFLRESLY